MSQVVFCGKVSDFHVSDSMVRTWVIHDDDETSDALGALGGTQERVDRLNLDEAVNERSKLRCLEERDSSNVVVSGHVSLEVLPPEEKSYACLRPLLAGPSIFVKDLLDSKRYVRPRRLVAGIRSLKAQGQPIERENGTRTFEESRQPADTRILGVPDVGVVNGGHTKERGVVHHRNHRIFVSIDRMNQQPMIKLEGLGQARILQF